MFRANGVRRAAYGLRVRRLVVLLLASLLTLVTVPAGGAAHAVVEPLPSGTDVDYQLGGEAPVPAHVGIVARDRTARALPGKYNICYVNGFQTQPDQKRFWRRHWNLVLKKDGRPVVDENWGEWLLDIGTPAKRQKLARIVGRWITGCRRDGFQAVELDNLDSWTRSAGALDADDALALATLLVDHAHGRGLAVAQKNATDIGSRGRDEAGFDFAIAEECDRWSECADHTAVYGPHVLDVEYADDLLDTAEGACARIRALDPAPRAIVRDRDLVPASEDGYAFAAC